MIGALEGRVVRIRSDRCWLQVHGVSYVVCVGQALAGELHLDQTVFLWIASTVHDGQTSLFGFQEEEQERWFYQLIAVTGVGGKVAMAILSALPPVALAQTLIQQESALLRAIDGVGPKLAARLLTELKAFAHKWSIEHAALVPASQPLHHEGGGGVHGHGLPPLHPSAWISQRVDAVQALVSLGYKRMDAEHVIGTLAQQTPHQPDQRSLTAQHLVTMALPLLSSLNRD